MKITLRKDDDFEGRFYLNGAPTSIVLEKYQGGGWAVFKLVSGSPWLWICDCSAKKDAVQIVKLIGSAFCEAQSTGGISA